MLAGDLQGERTYPFQLHSTRYSVGELPKIDERILALKLFFLKTKRNKQT